MKKILLAVVLFAITTTTFSQRLLSWAPEFPNDNSTMTVTVDCTKGNQGLLNYANTSDVYVHVGVNTNLSTGPGNWRYVKFANFNTTYPLAQATYLGNNKYSYTITDIRTFFGVPAGETINKVNIIFRTGNGSLKQVNSDNSDMYIPVYAAGQFAVRLNLPPFEPRFIPYAEPLNVVVGNSVNITGVASNNAALTIKFNGATVNTAASATTLSGVATVATQCEQKIIFEGNDGTGIKKDSFGFYITPTQTIAALPAGVVEGINYLPGNTSATLVLYAPNKTSVNVIGDFNNWTSTCAGQMNKTPDGNYYWITITGLTPGTEYGYQYLVDNTIKIADPYTQKILDQDNDQFITAVTYPNLKPYPAGLTSGLVGILQTAEPQYTWLANSFVKPDKRNLMAYELLIRDFTAEHSYQSLIDSLNYLKGIGINAIELMPINEFDGNESWGYNPSYFFAPDKYYGTKNKLKEFIDKCHLNGIAVILDVVYNHCTGNAAQAKLYWNSATNQPAANNPWLNVTATHPYSVFNDFNHNSTATKYFVQRNLNFWVDEYRVDGFRFDLAKGFSQTITNTTTVENYDPARVANLNYYYDNVVPTHPNTYMILEFLGSLPNQEEQEYVTKGFMPWGNLNARYNQCTMGFASNSDISAVVYNSSQRLFSAPSLMGYMESHDEERTMYKNLQFGNSSGGYDTKVLTTALAREEAVASVFFTVPGPKMIWQFEERGYDVSINFGGSNLTPKPPKWEYMLDPNRRKLYDAYKKMLDLRLNNPAVFNNTTFTYDFFNGGGLVKTFQIADPNASGKKVTIVANLDVVQQTKSVTFQATGDWANYLSTGTGTGVNGATNSTFNLTNATQSIVLAPGEYHIYVSVPACVTAAPTGTTTVTYCQNATATPLTATGTNLLWYTTATGGTGSTTAPTPSTATVGNTIYYVSQTLNGCEGPRLAITVTVNALPAAPTVLPSVTYCQGAVANPLTAIGVNLSWFIWATGVTTTTPPVPSTTVIGDLQYIVYQTVNGCRSNGTSDTVYIASIPSAPIVISPYNYCQNATAIPLTATGTNLLWFTAPTGGVGNTTAPIPATTTIGSTTYYVSQTNITNPNGATSGCIGPRAAITVNVNGIPAAPTVATPITYCQNATSTALTATGTNLKWYNTASGGTGSTVAPTPSTTTIGSTIYYVSQTVSTCESPRAAITVTITATTPAPTVTTPVTYCQNNIATPLTATGTNLLWYTTAIGGTGSITAPTPSTNTPGSTIYYVSQTQTCGESPRAAITVTVNALPAAPSVTTPIIYCQNATAIPLFAAGTNLLWYTVATGGTGSTTPPTPSTATVGTFTYYVSQTSNGCEGPRVAIFVVINAIPAAPVVSTPVTYCQNVPATALTATGTNLKWYNTATGGTGSSAAPIPFTGTVGVTIYYVSQTTNNCESPRAAITVNVVASTPAPTVTTPVTYCQNATATPLTAIGTSLLWYTAATGGTGSTTAPTPSTTTVGSTIYYVSQTLSCGEGPRAAITVTINAIPTAPIVTTPITYCQNATATALVATGTNLLWYSTPTGGGGVSTTPTPSTTTVGTVTYYVSQTVNGCEGPRASIVVTINAIPAAPTVITPVTLCQNTTATALTATGANLKWYTTATGGVGSAIAPIPSTTTVGSTIYYASQTTNNCESPRAAITVNVVASTPAPTVTTPITYCQNATATALTATGTNLLWYTTATGGTATTIAPIPSTITVGSTTYYVSQTLSCGEGPRAAITVTINAVPNAPTVTSPIAYCQNTTASALTATGINLLWYTAATGGIGSAIAPTPSTTTVGSVTYYVSQTITGCESPKAAIVVNTNITPAAPTTTSAVTYCQNATATALTATGTNVLWYTVATGGTGSAAAPIPSTTTAGITNYYVSQTVGVCEGPRAIVVVTVTALPAAATVTSPVTYCQNATATALSANGTGLLWFTNATVGTGSTTAPTPATTTAGSTSYYVAQTNSCGEGPRVAIVVNVTSTPAAPTSLNTTNVTLNSATLNWTGAANNYYTVEYKLTSATIWTTAATGIQATTYNLTGLTIGSEYQWRVSANCAATGVGNFATAPLFNTASRNNIITVIEDGIGLKISPNPVTTTAIIDYIVPATGEVTFNIIDQYGRTVKTFSEGQKVAGQYQKDIVGEFRSMLSGAYFIRIQQNGKKITLPFVKY
jgi:Alpha amylase, catalytic domain/Ig-like domain CHU_C associated/Carbohydrate-binding module 48 (Isoamylase N-terminal domain)